MFDREAKARNALDRHATYFAQVLEQHASRLHGANQKAALNEMTVEFDNIRAAWNWALERENAGWLAAMLECLLGYADKRGHVLEMLNLFQRGHQRISGGWRVFAPELCHRLRAGHGELLLRLGRNNEAKPLLEAALGELERLGSASAWRVSLIHAQLLLNLGELNRAKAEAQTVIDAAKPVSHHLRTDALRLKGAILAQQGEYQTAIALLEQARSEYEQMGDRLECADTLIQLSVAWYNGGDKNADQIYAAMEQALEIQREFDDHQGIVATLSNIGYVHDLRDEFDEARSAYHESLSLATRYGLNKEILRNQFRMAGLEQSLGQLERAYAQFEVCVAQAKIQHNHWILVRSIGTLGEIALELERFDVAREHFRESIRMAWDASETPTVLTLLEIVAGLEARSDPIWAQQLALLVTQHPAAQSRDRDSAQLLLERLQLVSTQPIQTISLEAVVERLLE